MVGKAIVLGYIGLVGLTVYVLDEFNFLQKYRYEGDTVPMLWSLLPPVAWYKVGRLLKEGDEK